MQRLVLRKFSDRNPFLKKVQTNLKPHQEKLFSHQLYKSIKNQDETRIFMANHVFAVWDFMSLLKTLQRHLTSVEIPWIPRPNPSLSHFINEIVLGEESDDLGTNDATNAISHYDLYVKAMAEVQADSSAIEYFIKSQIEGIHWRKALKETKSKFTANDGIICDYTIDFVKTTITLCENAPAHVIASMFLFGREDPIPKMFGHILSNLESEKIFCPNLKVYLARHIEVDGDRHSILAQNMILELCGNEEEKWNDSEEIAIKVINERIKLWDSILLKINDCKRKTLSL